jgi:C_GCAxxG_C_C family probable redox protein
MVDHNRLQERVRQLAEREWDLSSIRARYRDLSEKGIPLQVPEPSETGQGQQDILDRIQQRAEEYEFLSHNCAKGSALALMEAFGLGSLEILKGLSPFPGIGMTGWICGGVTGSLLALGLYFGSHDIDNFEGNRRAMDAAREFIPRFEAEMGSILCPKIQEDAIFGRYMDPRASQENFEAFREAKGYVKCALPAGIGARIAAQIILEHIQKESPA